MAVSPFDKPPCAWDLRSLLSGRLVAIRRELVELLSGPDFDPFRIETLIGYDPILTAQILRHAREVADDVEVEDLWTAVLGLGGEALREIAGSSAPAGGRWNWSGGWKESGGLLEQSIATAYAARLSMRSRAPGRQSQAHTAGLLCDLGQYLMLHHFGNEWMRFRAAQRFVNGRIDPHEERARFGIDTRQAGEELALAWKLPEFVLEAIRRHDTGLLGEVLIEARELVNAGGLAGNFAPGSNPGELPAEKRDNNWGSVLEHLRALAQRLGASYRGPGDLGRLLDQTQQPFAEPRSLSLRAVADWIRALDQRGSEAEVVQWTRRSALERTHFERARIFLWEDTEHLYREVLATGSAFRHRPGEMSDSAVDAVLDQGEGPFRRLAPGVLPLPGEDGAASSDRLVFPLGRDHESRAVGLLFLDRPYSGRPARRQDVEVLEMFCGAAGARLAHERLRRALESFRNDAERDYLTGIYNRRSTIRLLEREMARARRNETPLALALLDIDNFKAFNDMYGHLAGDTVLREVARLLNETARESDVVGRFGGEEFLIVLPEATIEAAYLFAERLRVVVETFGKEKIHQYPDNPPTISIGVSWVVPERDNPDDAIERVDKALYGSKRGGRNRVCLEPAEPAV